MNVLVNKNAPLLRGGGDKLKNFVVVSVSVVVVVCCGDIDIGIDIDIDIIIDRTLLLIVYSYIFFVFFSFMCCFFGGIKGVCVSSKFEQRRTKLKKHACLASIIQNGIP